MTTTTLEEPSRSSASDHEIALTKLRGYSLNKRQRLVLHPKNWANDILYGGARGGGKSFLIRYIFCLWCAQAPGMLCYLFRRTHDELIKNHMEGPTSFPALLADEVAKGNCRIVGRQVRWRNGARIFLSHMQLEKHKYKYHGFEMHALAIDQATDFTESQIRYVFSSVRLGNWRPPPDFPWKDRLPFILLGANPGGPSHTFIKSRYVDLEPNKIVTGYEIGERGTSRQFIPARAEDNPELLRNDPLYLERLELLGDPVLVRAMREGDWSIIAGSMFGDVWRPQIIDRNTGAPRSWHVCDEFAIPVGWPLWRGGDDGFAKPLAYYWLTRDPDRDTIYVVDELYGTNMSAPEAKERTREKELRIAFFDPRDRRFLYNTEPRNGTLDSAAFANVGSSELSRGDQMNAEPNGLAWEPAQKWAGSRVARIQNFHRLLKPNAKEQNRRPGIVFFRRCKHAIETIPRLLRDETNIEDIADDQEDHPFDGVTYGLQHTPLSAGRVPVHF